MTEVVDVSLATFGLARLGKAMSWLFKSGGRNEAAELRRTRLRRYQTLTAAVRYRNRLHRSSTIYI